MAVLGPACPQSGGEWKYNIPNNTACQSPDPPVVRIPKNQSYSHDQVVLGRISALTSSVEEFCGIPYGIVPKRWHHSILRTSLPEDIFDASRHGPKCPQPSAPNSSRLYQSYASFPDVGESEFDCLNLFIVRPSPAALSRAGYNSAQTKLPVYFYIHGGAFGFGAGSDPIWDPTRLIQQSLALRKPFIAVVINYRLNLFGFAAASSIIATQEGSQLKGCNFGIHDQKIALMWVHENISSFGGDPDNITLGGQSAGGCSVHTHVLETRSSSESPLFKRAIIQSGAFTSVGIGPVSLEDCDKRWCTLYDYFGLTDQPEAQRLETLRSMPASDLVKAGEHLGWMVFSLTSDNLTITTTSDTEWTVNFGQREHSQNIPPAEPIEVLIGNTESDGGIFVANALPKLQSYDKILSLFQESFTSELTANEFIEIYGMGPSVPLAVLHQGLIEFTTDVTFGYSIFSTYQDLNSEGRSTETATIRRTSPSTNCSTKAQLYKVEFGNPFPGPFYHVSHHCVDLIYIFDAFHDDLDAVNEQSLGNATWASNSALRQHLQTTWVEFITVQGKGINKDLALVYGRDRIARMESLRDSPKWMHHRRRFDLIAAHRRETASVMHKLFALAR